MHETRAFLRTLLSLLIARQPGAENLYIPRGEAGIRRMIRALLAQRPPTGEEDPLAPMIEAFYALENSGKSDASLEQD